MQKIDGISIVVATKGRVNLLEELLQGINVARKNCEKPCEIIFVDDSEAKDQKKIETLCKEYDAILEKYTNSVAMKRTHGVDIAKYNLILFLDSDCKPVPEILKSHSECYTNEKIGAAAGPLIFEGNENWFWKCVALTPFLICFKMPLWGETVPWGATANFSVRKEVFNKINGFSGEFPNKPGGEDVDLGLMITKAGYTIKSLPDAVVYHAKETWSQVKPMYKRAWYYGAADFYLVNRHQERVCDAVPRRIGISFWMTLVFIFFSIFVSPWYLLGIPTWYLLDIMIMAGIMCKTGFERSGFFQQCVVQTIIIVNELGYVVNCLKHRKLRYIDKQIIYFENQLKGTMTNGHATFWRFTMSYIIVLGSIAAGKILNIL